MIRSPTCKTSNPLDDFCKVDPELDNNFGGKANVDDISVEILPEDRKDQKETTEGPSEGIDQKPAPDSSSINDLGPGENIKEFAEFTIVTESFKNQTTTVADKIAVNLPTLQVYPSLEDMESKILNGTFEWSKTARSILFLKKHKCASSTLR